MDCLTNFETSILAPTATDTFFSQFNLFLYFRILFLSCSLYFSCLYIMLSLPGENKEINQSMYLRSRNGLDTCKEVRTYFLPKNKQLNKYIKTIIINNNKKKINK